MINYGFVYILSNTSMPNIYKIGSTDRAPLQRVAELSSSTSCPEPFELVMYMQVDNPKNSERECHEFFKNYRISDNREFFKFDFEYLFRQVFPYFQENCFDYTFCGEYYMLEDKYMKNSIVENNK